MRENQINLNIGPHNPPVIGPMQIQVQTDGQTIFHANPNVGYLHRGIEKIGEKMAWADFMPYTDRVDYLAAIHCNLAYTLAVESLLKITIPKRAHVIRVIVSELNRIASHLFSLGHLANQMGSSTLFMYGLRDREKINDLFEMLCGARLTYNYIRIGGVSFDLTDGFMDKTIKFLEKFEQKLKEYDELLTQNPIFKNKLSNLGVVTLAQAISCGLTGPALRACGLEYDVRKLFPYSGYELFDFKVPVGSAQTSTMGDSWNRLTVRIEEMAQSVFIIKQALKKMPSGEYLVPQERLLKVLKGESYACVESPRGTLGVYVCSTGESSPMRVRFRTPSFSILNLFPEILQNVRLSDAGPIIASFDVMASEVDR